MGEWTTKKLADVVELRRGFDLPTRQRNPGPFPVLSAGVTAGWHDEAPIKGPGFVVGRATNLGVPIWCEGDFWPLNTTLYAADFKGNSPRYLFHLFESINLAGFNSGSVQPMLNRNYIGDVDVRVPSLAAQEGIADVLRALDDKIAANDGVLSQLEELAAAEYETAVQAGTRQVALGQAAAFHNKRRVPLSGRERETRTGAVPYYGAAGRLDYVDEALFDEQLVLIGEDGTVMRDGGRPVVQYVWGPAWVNNHAHVLTGTMVSTETLRLAIACSSIAHLVTGAVQPKLSMGNLKSLALEIPDNRDALERKISNFTALIRVTTNQNQSLLKTRNELLPLLMSGKLRVREAEKVVEEVV